MCWSLIAGRGQAKACGVAAGARVGVATGAGVAAAVGVREPEPQAAAITAETAKDA